MHDQAQGAPGQALARSRTVPTSAAGAQPLFVFGTLMDPDVLRIVLARPFAAAMLEPARLAGFRCEVAAGFTFPVLVADAAGVVDGLLLHADAHDIARINHYEADEYLAELHAVRTEEGATLGAWVFAGLEGPVQASGVAWDYARWRRQDQPGWLASCAAIMASFDPAH